MHFLRPFILAILSCYAVAYTPYNALLSAQISRKVMLRLIGCNIAGLAIMPLTPATFADDDNNNNPPLTPEQMEEYNKLLKDAERIKSIIDANKKALIPDDGETNDLEKFLKEKKEDKK